MTKTSRNGLGRILEFLDKVFRRLGYGFVNYDRVMPYGASLSTHRVVPKEGFVCGPLSHFLLVPKNRYKITLRPGAEDAPDRAIGWLVESNTAESYDRLWGDPANLERYRTEGGGNRTRLNKIVAAYIASLAKEGQKALEIGCGPGDLMAEILSQRPSLQAYGFDFSAKAVELARKLIPQGVFIHHHFVDSLPYESESFDLAFFVDVLEHVDHPEKLMDEAVRILKPGGTLFLLAPDGDRDDFIGHQWFWNKEQLARFLSRWGARAVELEGIEESAAVLEKPAANPAAARR